jgi:hypothetical protein
MRSGDPGPDRPWRMLRVGRDLLCVTRSVPAALAGCRRSAPGCGRLRCHTRHEAHGAYLFTAANLSTDVIGFLPCIARVATAVRRAATIRTSSLSDFCTSDRFRRDQRSTCTATCKADAENSLELGLSRNSSNESRGWSTY